MAVANNDILRVALRQKWAGTDDMINVIHYRVDTAPAGFAESDVLEDLSDGLSTKWGAIDSHLSDNLEPIDMSVYNITQDQPVGTIGWTTDYNGGAATGDSLPTFCAALIFFPTYVKRRVGRLFIGGLSEAAGSAGFLGSAVVSAMLNFGTSLLSLTGGPNSGEYTLVVYSRSAGVATVPAFARATNLIAIQQRRKRGRGS